MMILNSIYIYICVYHMYIYIYIYMISSMFVAVFIPVHWYWYFIGNCGSIYGFCGMNKKNSEIMVMVVDLVLWSPVSNLVSNGAPFWTVKNKQTKELFVVTKGFLKEMWPFLLAVMEWRLHSVTLPHLPRHVIARTKSQSDYCFMVSRRHKNQWICWYTHVGWCWCVFKRDYRFTLWSTGGSLYIYIYIVYWISGPHENEQLGW